MKEDQVLAQIEKEAHKMVDEMNRTIKGVDGNVQHAQLIAAYLIAEIAKIKVLLGLNK